VISAAEAAIAGNWFSAALKRCATQRRKNQSTTEVLGHEEERQ